MKSILKIIFATFLLGSSLVYADVVLRPGEMTYGRDGERIFCTGNREVVKICDCKYESIKVGEIILNPELSPNQQCKELNSITTPTNCREIRGFPVTCDCKYETVKVGEIIVYPQMNASTLCKELNTITTPYNCR